MADYVPLGLQGERLNHDLRNEKSGTVAQEFPKRQFRSLSLMGGFCVRSVNFDLLALRGRCRFRQVHLQDAVLELGADVRVVDAVDVERAADFARMTLAADVVSVVVLFIL